MELTEYLQDLAQKANLLVPLLEKPLGLDQINRLLATSTEEFYLDQPQPKHDDGPTSAEV